MALVLILPSPTFAAMPNANINGYKQAEKCVTPPDKPVYEIVEGILKIVGCYTPETWVNAQTSATMLQATGVKFAPSTSVTLKSGKTEICDAWFPKGGCIIEKNLVK